MSVIGPRILAIDLSSFSYGSDGPELVLAMFLESPDRQAGALKPLRVAQNQSCLMQWHTPDKGFS